MNEQAKTVVDSIIAWGQVKHGLMSSAAARKDFEDTVNLALGVLQRCPALSFNIIPGADAVATEEDLLAVGYAYEFAHKAALDTNDYEAGLIAGARALLAAAGIRVANEVVKVRAHPEESYAVPIEGAECPHPQAMLRRGDRIYIVRA
ncbi:hypothetical protein KAW64_05230, partial [bacterium]|nr:hypothetical protein [bacterium]